MRWLSRSKNAIDDLQVKLDDIGPLRSYLYASDRKIDSLMAQIEGSRDVSLDLKATLKVIEVARHSEPAEVTRERKISLVERYLRVNDSVAKPFEGNRWVADTREIHWGRIGYGRGQEAAVGVFGDDENMLLLGGSTKHLLSATEAAALPVAGPASSEPQEVFELARDVLSSMDRHDEWATTKLDDWAGGAMLQRLIGQPESEWRSADGGLGLPLLTVTFLARIYQSLHPNETWLPSQIRLASPLYVYLA
jgi:hypothetical protein